MPIVTPGKHRAHAREAQIDASENGTPCVVVIFETATGAHGWWRGYLTERASARTIETLRLCGARMRDGDITDLDGIGNNEVEIDCAEEEYLGKKTVRINWVNSVRRTPRPTRISAEAKQALVDRLRAQVVSAAVQPPDEDDNVLF